MTTVTPPSPTADAIAEPWASEQTITCRDDRVGLRAVIAIDDTTLGPGFGGVRYRAYPSTEAAAREAQRLAAAMTLKHALAELPYGGAKSVVVLDGQVPAPGSPERRALFARFGEMIARTAGTYIPGVDMGTLLEDMQTIRDDGGARAFCDEVSPPPSPPVACTPPCAPPRSTSTAKGASTGCTSSSRASAAWARRSPASPTVTAPA